MKNVQQTVMFPVATLIRAELDETQKELLAKIRQTRRVAEGLRSACEKLKADGKEVAQDMLDAASKAESELAPLLEQAATTVTDKQKREMAFFGAELFSDDVPVNMKLGNVLFDLYLLMTPEPASPLGKLVWKKKNTELAEILDKEDLEIPQSARKVIQKAMLDEAVWNTTNLSVWAEVKDGDKKVQRYFSISAKGSVYFKSVLDAAAEALYDEDLSK